MKFPSHIPVFILGAQRSGTTMLRLMVNAHPRFAVPFEINFLAPVDRGGIDPNFADEAAARRALELLADDKFSKKGRLVRDAAAIPLDAVRTYGQLLDAVLTAYAREHGKPRWAVKTPGYATEIDRIHGLFPEAKIVHIVRDGRDVALSYRNISWGSRHTPKVAEEWKWNVTLGSKMGRMLGPNYHELRYEDLVLQTESTLRRLCNFLAEPYDSSMLRYYESAATEMPADSLRWHRASVSAPDESKVYAWKSQLPVADQVIFDDIAGKTLAQFGYERTSVRAPLRATLKRLHYSLLQRW